MQKDQHIKGTMTEKPPNFTMKVDSAKQCRRIQARVLQFTTRPFPLRNRLKTTKGKVQKQAARPEPQPILRPIRRRPKWAAALMGSTELPDAAAAVDPGGFTGKGGFGGKGGGGFGGGAGGSFIQPSKRRLWRQRRRGLRRRSGRRFWRRPRVCGGVLETFFLRGGAGPAAEGAL